MSNYHNIKILKEFANAVYEGTKTFEVRKNDRDYKIKDIVIFTVVDSDGNFISDHPLNDKHYEITYILSGWGVEEGYVVFGIKPILPAIYTHDEAMLIIEMFEDILSANNIIIPSPEDDDRDHENMIGLYGSTYSDLLDSVEDNIIDLISRSGNISPIIEYEFSGNVWKE